MHFPDEGIKFLKKRDQFFSLDTVPNLKSSPILQWEVQKFQSEVQAALLQVKVYSVFSK